MTQAQKVKTILDDNKFKLTAKPIESGARPPTFQLGTYFNNPQLTVYPNHDNGSGCTWISAGMDVHSFAFLLELLKEMANNPQGGECQHEIENKRDIPKEKRTDPKVTKQVVSKTQIGRDADGKLWISVLDNLKPNAPKIRFYFALNYFHSVRSKPAMSPGDYSRIHCLGWVANAETYMAGILLNNPNAEADRAQIAAKFGGNSGGGGKGNYGGGQKKSYGNNSNSGGGGAAPADDGFGGNFDGEDGDDW